MTIFAFSVLGLVFYLVHLNYKADSQIF